MAQIHNPETIKRILDDAGIQTGREDAPNQLASKIVPVLISNPANVSRVLGVLNDKSVTASGTLIMTSDSEKETYITGLMVSNDSDVTADNTKIILFADVNSKSQRIYIKHKPTTTAENYMDFVCFKSPLKIDKNSNITFTNTFTAGASITTITIFGYTV